MWGEGEEPTKIVMVDGTIIWSLHDQLHRLDGPARITPGGTTEWRFKDSLHRLDGPAIIHNDGTQEWYNMDRRHRIDGPAFISKGGTRKWFVDGNFYRPNPTDPVIIYGEDLSSTIIEFEWIIPGTSPGLNTIITDDVYRWMHENNIRYPFNKREEMEFALRFL